MIAWSLNNSSFSLYNNMIIVRKWLLGILGTMGESYAQAGWFFWPELTKWNPYLSHHFIQQGCKCYFKQESIKSHFLRKEMRSFEQATDHTWAWVLVWRLQGKRAVNESQWSLTPSHGHGHPGDSLGPGPCPASSQAHLGEAEALCKDSCLLLFELISAKTDFLFVI